ncbi:MAG: GNAT family N-acetyltransferase [Blastocatellia bacterium]|nr:GNAT family N-acetyltransferase [Blastocatellia bacterium]
MLPQQQYFLHSQRLGWRQWQVSDLALALGLWGDQEVTALIGGPFSAAQVQARLAQEIKNQQEFGLQYWPIFHVTTGDHIGCCGLRPYRTDELVYELGFHLRKAHWGQGYAQEAAQIVISYAFEALGAAALFAGHNPANGSSRRLLEKLGFTYTHHEFYAPTGLDHPCYLLRKPTEPLA